MGETIDELRSIVDQVLGKQASPYMLAKVRRLLDEVGQGQTELREACQRVIRMTNLFIGPDLAQVLEPRLSAVLAKGDQSEALDAGSP